MPFFDSCGPRESRPRSGPRPKPVGAPRLLAGRVSLPREHFLLVSSRDFWARRSPGPVVSRDPSSLTATPRLS